MSVASAGFLIASGLVASRFLATGWQLLAFLLADLVDGELRDWFQIRAAQLDRIGDVGGRDIPNRLHFALLVVAVAIGPGVSFVPGEEAWLSEPGAFLGVLGGADLLLVDLVRRRYWARWEEARTAQRGLSEP